MQVQNCYISKRDALAVPESRTAPMTVQKDIAMEESVISAAYMVADADNKSYLAFEAVKEAERVMKMCEEAECFMNVAKEIHERCMSPQCLVISL